MIVAPSRLSTDWSPALDEIDLDALSPLQREAIARRWTRDAELEHASVASFSQLSLALLACGAPPELVAETHQSALDEIRHAELCYGLASVYGGSPIGPGPLAPPPKATSDVIALAVETYRDGCIGETAAALVAARSAELCENRAVAGALRSIAADEERHAELAWRILKWTLAFDGVCDALLAEVEALRHEPEPSTGHPGELARHGLLAKAAEVRIRSQVVKQVVLPCTEALLEKTVRS
jgi:hypothetical protein